MKYLKLIGFATLASCLGAFRSWLQWLFMDRVWFMKEPEVHLFPFISAHNWWEFTGGRYRAIMLWHTARWTALPNQMSSATRTSSRLSFQTISETHHARLAASLSLFPVSLRPLFLNRHFSYLWQNVNIAAGNVSDRARQSAHGSCFMDIDVGNSLQIVYKLESWVAVSGPWVAADTDGLWLLWRWVIITSYLPKCMHEFLHININNLLHCWKKISLIYPQHLSESPPKILGFLY